MSLLHRPCRHSSCNRGLPGESPQLREEEGDEQPATEAERADEAKPV